ncbi:DUF4214 domain-containing protein, partial [Halobellus sp. Atlit-31R]
GHGQDGYTSYRGSAADDRLGAGYGYSAIDGGEGIDTVQFQTAADGYTLRTTDAGLEVLWYGTLATSLTNVERLGFQDDYIAFDLVAAQAYRLYRAAFERAPDKAGLGYWISRLDGGVSLKEVAAAFLASAEFGVAAGVRQDDAQFVDTLYRHVL